MKVVNLEFLKSKKSSRAVIVMESQSTPLTHLTGQGTVIGWLRANENEQDDLINEIKAFDSIEFKVINQGDSMNEITVTEVS